MELPCKNGVLPSLGETYLEAYFFTNGGPMFSVPDVSENFQDQIIKRIFQSRPDLLDAFSNAELEIGGYGLESFIRTTIPQASLSAAKLLWQNRLEICRLLAKFSSCRLWKFQIQGGKAISFPVREIAVMNQSKIRQVSNYEIHPFEAPLANYTGERFYFLLDADGRYLEVQCPSEGKGKLWIPADEMIGKTLEECMPADLAGPRRYYLETVVKTRKELVFCHTFMVDDRWTAYEIRIVPMGNNVLMICSRLTVSNLAVLGLRENYRPNP